MNKLIHTVSGIMVVSNGEKKFLQTSLSNIYDHVDELVIVDNNTKDGSVEVIKEFNDPKKKIRLITIPFFDKMNFTIGGIKNFACELAKNWWHLVLDPDEIIENKFYEQIHNIIDKEAFDVIALPRRNYINGKLTEAYPDWQLRFRRAFCTYATHIHHELVGWKQRIELPMEDGFHIIHRKQASRQADQNNLYDTMKLKYQYKERHDHEQF